MRRKILNESICWKSGCCSCKNLFSAKRLNETGYYLSFEAIVSLALLGSLLAMPLHDSNTNLNDLHVFKKENDLLLHWAKTDSLNEETIEQEFKFAFPEKSGEIFWNGKKISIGKQGKESISSKAIFFDKSLQEQEIILIVFKQDFP